MLFYSSIAHVLWFNYTHFQVTLCVQAYRARDVREEFSEARGVALALFSWLQIFIIAVPIEGLLTEETPLPLTIIYALSVLVDFMRNMSLLLFIFFPLILHQRKFRREGGTMNVHVTGVTVGTESSGTGQIGSLGSVEELHNARSRISELEQLVASLNERLALRNDIESRHENDGERNLVGSQSPNEPCCGSVSGATISTHE